MKKLVFGIGVNNADYTVQIKRGVVEKSGDKVVEKLIWICPFYERWKNMLSRCYNPKFISRRPTYSGCCTSPEWHYFMTFRSWMEQQDWQNKVLDKDILFPGNKVYGPDSCVFIDEKVNSFLTESTASRGQWPIGVYLYKPSGKYRAQCRDVNTRKQEYLGTFDTPEEAHQAWLSFKLQQAKTLASEQSDPRVAKALIERYTNYGH